MRKLAKRAVSAAGVFRAAIGAAAVCAAAVAVVWCVWYVATEHTVLFSALVLVGGAAAIVFALARRRAHG